MKTETTTKGPGRRKGARGDSTFMTKSQLAHAMGEADPGTIDEWVAAGTVPPPHSRPGERTSLWLRRDFDHYVTHRRWPEEAFRRAGG